VLVRHGATQPKVPGEPFPLRNGHGDPPLEPTGVEQAQLVCARLVSEHRTGAPVDAVYVTTLQRTRQTIQSFLDAVGMEARVEADLREVFLGEWEGGGIRERIAAMDPIWLRMRAEQRWDVIPGAESEEGFRGRCQAGLARIVDAHRGGRVVVVVHGGVIGTLMAVAATSAGAFSFNGADNCSISEIVVEADGTQRVRRFNDTAHLDGLAHHGGFGRIDR
jgi:2,3-bisphosphoglycerate-dependent phosphoglycerate mutase